VEQHAATERAHWTPAQVGVMAICVFQLGWALAGFIAEPSFATGADAPTEQVLGVDFNGWHALSGLLLFGPGVVFALRPDWALLFAVAAGVLLVITGVWALASTQVALVFTFPNNEADAVLHLATGALFLVIAAAQRRRDRAA
jgi:Domain of unknown function (DUF4383)